MAQHFLDNKQDVVVVDSLVNSTKSRINFLEGNFGPSRFSFHETDIRDTARINELMRDQDFDGVVHLAALKSVEDSFKNENLYKKSSFLFSKFKIEIKKTFISLLNFKNVYLQ